jgi:hypothetical protein
MTDPFQFQPISLSAIRTAHLKLKAAKQAVKRADYTTIEIAVLEKNTAEKHLETLLDGLVELS